MQPFPPPQMARIAPAEILVTCFMHVARGDCGERARPEKVTHTAPSPYLVVKRVYKCARGGSARKGPRIKYLKTKGRRKGGVVVTAYAPAVA